ncbi:hypothetical protein IP70_17805 [alpha proteobacterium AAP38]|nr:hypothetical protein IP70_17805 [alpha proteobacterium AAP38]
MKATLGPGGSGGLADIAFRRATLRDNLLQRRFIFAANKAALHPQFPFRVHTNIAAGPRHFVGIETLRPLLQLRDFTRQRGQPLIDLLGDVLARVMFFGQPFIFGGKVGVPRLLSLRPGNDLSLQAALTDGVAIEEIDIHLDPFPALRHHPLGGLGQLFRHQPFQQRHITQPSAVIRGEQVAHDRTTGGDIGVQPDKAGALVIGGDAACRQGTADVIGLLLPGLGQRGPNLLLALMAVADAEDHQHVEVHAIVGIDLQQLGRDRRQPQPLFHHRRRDKEAGGDVFFAEALVHQGLEGAELIQRMQRHPLQVLRQTVLLAQPLGADDARDGGRCGLGASA